MKQKQFPTVLGAVAIIAVILGFTYKGVDAQAWLLIGESIRTWVMASPWASGLVLALGAGLSWVFPLFAWKHAAHWEKALHILLALFMSLSLWIILNPGFIKVQAPELREGVMGMAATCSISILVLWVVMALLKLFRTGNKNQVAGYLGSLLKVICLCIASIEIIYTTASLVNTLHTTQTNATVFLAIFHSVLAHLSTILEIGVILHALRVLNSIQKEDRNQASIAAKKLSHFCCMALAIITGSTVLFNGIQLLCTAGAAQIRIQAEMPLSGLVVVLAVLLLSRLVEENTRLADDNDSII